MTDDEFDTDDLYIGDEEVIEGDALKIASLVITGGNAGAEIYRVLNESQSRALTTIIAERAAGKALLHAIQTENAFESVQTMRALSSMVRSANRVAHWRRPVSRGDGLEQGSPGD